MFNIGYTILSIVLIFTFSFTILANNLGGTRWIINEDDGEEKIINFEKDGTFSFTNISKSSLDTGKIYNDNSDTWYINKGMLVISYTNGYKLCSGKLTSQKIISGNCINKNALFDKFIMRVID